MKKAICALSQDEKRSMLSELKGQYEAFKARKLSLDMSRGKPNSDQLDLALGVLDMSGSSTGYVSSDGTDCRNYGMLCGIPKARALMAELLGRDASEVIVGGNSSLNLMFDTVARAFVQGVVGSERPWCKEDEIIFLCPAPGYDRHFAICEYFGIKMIPIQMDENGPDMDEVEKYVNGNKNVKAIWCVPKYSNPTGITYSDEVVRRFANLKPAAKDFRILWDNAYVVHGVYDEDDKLLNLSELLKQNGNENMLLEFASTSKISFAGAGISAMCASKENIALIEKQLSIQTIGYDKISQQIHVSYFKDIDGIKKHMKKHAELLRPKFDMVLNMLESELGGLGIATWTKPRGGYFISLDVDGCAKRIVSLCAEAGVKLTGAGATFPYGKDPKDSNIRIAPTYPSVEELKTATELLCLSAKLAVLERQLA